MLYAFICTDIPDTLQKRLASRPKHVARLKELQAQGRLIIAGPHPAIDSNDPDSAGFTGSLIIAEFDSLKEAESWAKLEPYVEAGVYDSIHVKPFIQALP
jgi:hypothetical protein